MDAGFRTVAAKYFKNTIFPLLVKFALLLDSDAVQGWGRLSKEEDMKLDRQLKLINKPAIKTFQVKDKHNSRRYTHWIDRWLPKDWPLQCSLPRTYTTYLCHYPWPHSSTIYLQWSSK